MAAVPVVDVASLVLTLYGEAKKQVPRLEDEVTVEVVGQPGATKKQLYYLALSTAFGILRRFDLGVGRFFLSAPAGMLMCEYDAADNWVRATVRLNTGLAVAAAGLVTSIGGLIPVVGTLVAGQIEAYLRDTANRPSGLYGEAVVYSGPKEEVVGGPFNFVGVVTPAIPSTSRSQGAPQLPFEGRTILTPSPTCPDPDPTTPVGAGQTIPTPNPKPPGDNRSRGTYPIENASPNDPLRGITTNSRDMVRLLVPLVYAALTDPGGSADTTYQPPAGGPAGG